MPVDLDEHSIPGFVWNIFAGGILPRGFSPKKRNVGFDENVAVNFCDVINLQQCVML